MKSTTGTVKNSTAKSSFKAHERYIVRHLDISDSGDGRLLVSKHMIDETVVIGIDIGGTWIRVALANESQIIATEATSWPGNLSPAAEIDFIAEFAQSLVSENRTANDVVAVGVSLAALVDDDGIVIAWPNRSNWRGLSFKNLLEARLGLPLIVEDDANAAALGEWRFGAGRGYQHLMVMSVGTGVGCGLILNHSLFRGKTGWAGELGHLVMLPDGIECPCGHRGCLQTIASGRALERVALARNLSGPSGFVNAAQEGQAWALDELANCGQWLGLAAANVVNLLDLEAVVVGGGFSSASSAWWDALTETFYRNILNQDHRRVHLHKTALSGMAGLMGATTLALQVAISREAR